MPASKLHAAFIEPMLLLRTEKLPDATTWLYELKLDGFRAIAFKSNSNVCLRSRNDKDFNTKYPAIVKALQSMPDETVIDGEIVAFDKSGRPSFNALQNYGAPFGPLFFYVFDVMVVSGESVMVQPLEMRRKILGAQAAIGSAQVHRRLPGIISPSSGEGHAARSRRLQPLQHTVATVAR